MNEYLSEEQLAALAAEHPGEVVLVRVRSMTADGKFQLGALDAHKAIEEGLIMRDPRGFSFRLPDDIRDVLYHGKVVV